MAAQRRRLAFAGTPEFAATALQALIDAGHDIALVLTQPDRPAGRGLQLQASAVKQLALSHGLPIAQPTSLKLDGRYPDEAAAAQQALLAAEPELMVVVAYGLILPQWVLRLPPMGCLNIHASLLPRWRGAAPIQRAIEAGDAQSGVCIMQMDEGLDTGDVRHRVVVPIAATDSASALHDRLALAGAKAIVHTLSHWEECPREAQALEGVNYAHKIDKAEAHIDWTLPAEVIERRIRAFDPFPGCQTSWGGERHKIWRAQVLSGDSSVAPALSSERSASTYGPAGRLLGISAEGIDVACGSGCLRILELQRSGGKRLGVQAFLNGTSLRPGLLADQ